MQRLRKSLHPTSQTPCSKFLRGSCYPALLTLQGQAELWKTWGFTFCLSPLLRIALLLITAAPAQSRLLPRQADSLRTPLGTTAWVVGQGGRGNSPQGRRWLWWPEECGPSAGCHGQRASPPAPGTKGERCEARAWAWAPSVQGFRLAVGC